MRGALAERLRARIRREGPIPVRDFMEAALYDTQDGYYARGPPIGREGDFYTASATSLFPPAVSRFVQAAAARLGGARVVELGAGMGDLATALGATVVEPSPGLAEGLRARGIPVVARPSELPPGPTVVVANEVLDALPVHRVHRTPDGFAQGRVDVRGDAFVEVLSPLEDPRLAAAAEGLRPHLPVGAAAEVNLDAEALLVDLRRAVPRGYALFLDYGGDPGEIYGEARPGGTLRGFRGHRVTDPLAHPGEQDITADVDFPAMVEAARRAGWTPAGLVDQGAFLADLGLVDDLMAALARGDTGAYLAGKNLLLPGGMGERFRALLLAADAPTTPPLPGFRQQPPRPRAGVGDL